jgi:5-methyltetrahydrofolate--homocysteine methyltransferase
MPQNLATSLFRINGLARSMRVQPTPSERVLWAALRGGQLGCRFRRQHVLHPFILDFYAPSARLVVEVDGDVHVGREARDAERTGELVRWHGVRVIRFTDVQVVAQLGVVVAAIRAAL